MRRIWLAGTVALATSLAGSVSVVGAERETRVAEPHVVRYATGACRQIWKCGRYGCDWHTICPRRCPDRYSCYPLYGAYGPYGGIGYWGAYTATGWGTYHR
jgi:hypothetical protein